MNKYPAPLPRQQVLELIEQAQQGDVNARNLVVLHNMRLVVSLVKRYGWGLIENGLELRDDLESEGALVLIRSINKFEADRNIEFSTYAGMSLRNFLLGLYKTNRIRRLIVDSRVACHSELEELVDQSDYDQPQKYDGIDVFPKLRFAMKTLDSRSRKIIKDRYYRNITLREVGKSLGISKERVRQIQDKALEQLGIILRS